MYAEPEIAVSRKIVHNSHLIFFLYFSDEMNPIFSNSVYHIGMFDKQEESPVLFGVSRTCQTDSS